MSGAAPTRVLHLRNSDIVGGPERLLLSQCARASPGMRMVLASFQTKGTPNRLLEQAATRGIETVAIPQRGSYDRRILKALRRAIESAPPDVLVGHDYKANVLLHLLRKRLERPRVAIVHGYTGENRRVRFFEAVDRRLLKRMDAVVVISQAMRDALLARGVSEERLHLVQNAIDADATAAAAAAERDALRALWGVGAEDTVLVSVGRLSPEKGHADLLEAFAVLLRDDPRMLLVVVGDGASRGALQARADQDDLRGRVRFAGWRTDPEAFVGAGDVFVLPSLTEELPLALLEAMAAERPVIATRVGAVPDALAEGEAGRLVAPGDPAGLADAVRDLLADPAARASLGRRAAERVRTRYGAERQARALEAVYASVARAS